MSFICMYGRRIFRKGRHGIGRRRVLGQVLFLCVIVGGLLWGRYSVLRET